MVLTRHVRLANRAPVPLPPPDDLPRSATGRLPQWVIDEAAGTADVPGGWRTPERGQEKAARPPRRRGAPVLTWVVALAVLGGGWWFTDGTLRLPEVAVSALAPGSGSGAPVPALAAPAPSAEVVAVADAAHLSIEGRELFYGARPELLDATAFAGRCGDGHTVRPPTDGAVGCFQPATNTIVIYRPPDPRLHGWVVETAAHETLHAAWEQLTSDEQAALVPLLEVEVGGLAVDDPIHQQIAGSVGGRPQSRPTELFAYVGTQVWRDGGLSPELERVYARFITDRAALVAVHTSFRALMEGMSADIQAASGALASRRMDLAQRRAQHEGDVASLGFYRQAYEQKAAEMAVLPAAQRGDVLLSWVWRDGTELPMAPAEDTLAAAAALLARDEAALPERDAALQAEEVAAAAEQARIEGLIADLEGLHAQLDPAASTE